MNSKMVIAAVLMAAALTGISLTTSTMAAYAQRDGTEDRVQDILTELGIVGVTGIGSEIEERDAFGDCIQKGLDVQTCILRTIEELRDSRVTTLTGADVEETETEETGIMSNPLFNLGQNSIG
jgi:hypothetical protein